MFRRNLSLLAQNTLKAERMLILASSPIAPGWAGLGKKGFTSLAEHVKR